MQQIFLIATGTASIAGGALLVADVNTMVSGYINEANGGSFTACWVGGTVSGEICGATAGIGGNLIYAASNTQNFALLGLMATGVDASYTGFLGRSIGSVLTDKIDGRAIGIMQEITLKFMV